jgi:5'-nucleotidase/UDP-sugar diphosphatase
MRRIRLPLVVLLLAVAASLPAQTLRRRAVAPPTVDAVTVLQTTDIHDHANGSGHNGLDVDPVTAMSQVGAYARIAAYVGSVRASSRRPVILVDSGDWTMGTMYDLTLASRPLALGFIASMHYDAVTLGNHEWDYTPRGLAQMLAAAQSSFGFSTPIVASNMDLHGNADLTPFFGSGKLIRQTYVETLSNGIKVGFIGLMGEDAALEAPASAPVSFLPLSSSYTFVQVLVDDLRNNQGAQIVIALSHSGTNASGTAGEDVELARHVRGINVIASGHTHTPLSAAHAVTNGTWTTQIIDAGATGTNVARLDLAVDRNAGTTTPLAFVNAPMTGTTIDATTAGLVGQTDKQLNGTLGPVLSQYFADYDANNIGKGIYHPVATAAQDMVPNDRNAVLAPNGLGDLAADSVRNVPNAIIAQALAAAGGNPANLPGYDVTPFQLGVVPTGVIRAPLQGGVPLTFSDIYNVLPLGISPDTSQALPVGYPLISAYVDLADLKKICALQLIGQSNLIGSSFYLNLSGIRYTLKPAESYTYFKYATAAAVLDTTSKKLAAGSSAALQAFSAVATMGIDKGAGVVGGAAAG